MQTVLYDTELSQIWRLFHGLDAAARHAIESGRTEIVDVSVGDSSATPTLGSEDVAALEQASASLSAVTYDWFGENLGSSGGQNRLADGGGCELLMILNPDTYPAPTALSELLRCFEVPTIAIAEARQLPLEHPKAFDATTGDTSWASGACMMVREDVFRALSGFDSKYFRLHCDDVDFSWRVRAAGHRVVYVPSAPVFHDKRPTLSDPWPATRAEQYHSVLGRLMLATRWNRPDIVELTISSVEADDSEPARRAVETFRDCARRGQVPEVAADPSVAEFVDGEYAVHRF